MSAYHVYQRCTRCGGKAQPGTQALLKYLLLKFPYTRSMGIYSCRDQRGSTSLSIHACGRALDLGVPTLSNGRANTSLGDPIIIFLDTYANELGLMGQIYNRARFDSKTPRGRYYGGTHPHYDHDHIEQRSSQAASLTYSRIVEICGPPTQEGEDQMLDRNTASPSSAVAMYQRDLIFLGYDLGDFESVQPSLYPQGADGDFGTMAENATKAFQQDMEIAVTGKGDALTVALAANLARFSEHPRQAGGVMKPITSGGGVSEAKVGELISAHAKTKASKTVHPHSHDEGATGQPQ